MKVFFLINSLGTGGSEGVVSRLAESFSRKKGVHVKVFTLNNVKEVPLLAPHRALSRTTSTAGYFALSPIIAGRFRRIAEKEKPDVIVSFLELSNFINVMVSKKIGARSVISVRANPTYVYKKGIYGLVFRRLIKKFYPRADHVITNSKLSKKDLSDNFGVDNAKIDVVHNPIDIANVQRLAKEPLPKGFSQVFNKKNKVIISVGRLTYLKGQEHLLESFARVKKKVRNAKLVLVGDGELRGALERRAKELGLEQDVVFAGSQKNPFKFVARSDLFIFTSLYEGFPNALLEALACGAPIVSVDCRSGPREILAPGTNPFREASGVEIAEFGVLVPPLGYLKSCHAVEQRLGFLESATIKVLNDPRLQSRYKSAGLRRVKAFEASSVSEEFFRSAMRRNVRS